MNRVLVFIMLFFLCGCNKDDNQKHYTPSLGSLNLDFELVDMDNRSLPAIWYCIAGDGMRMYLDPQEKLSGNYSLKMELGGPRNDVYKNCSFTNELPIEIFAGKNVEYRGWIKTKGVNDGYAGLIFTVYGENDVMRSNDNMRDRGLTGDNKWKQVSIKMFVPQDAQWVRFGGVFPGKGTVWFDHLELYIDGVKYIDSEPKIFLSQDEISALRPYIYPLRTCEPDGGDTKDLEVLGKLIGNSKLVGLGEVSHGSGKIFKLKNRFVQYLAMNQGFDIFSIEAGMPESYKLNDYLTRGEGDPKALLASTYFLSCRTEEVLNMVEWMRAFNGGARRIAFTGFDMQYYYEAANVLLDAFKGDHVVEDKIALLRAILGTRFYTNSFNINNTDMQMIVETLSFLQNSIEISMFQASQKEWLQQNIVIIRQFLGNTFYSRINWRDRCMASNIMWIEEHNPESKIVIWAHNFHVKKTAGRSVVMGNYLAGKYQDGYTTFGFVFFDGSYTAAGREGLTSYNAVSAYPGTLEHLLNQLNEPLFILDLKKIKSDNNKDTKWLLEPIAYRSTGTVEGDGTIEFKQEKIADDFDYLIFIKTSTPSTVFPVP